VCFKKDGVGLAMVPLMVVVVSDGSIIVRRRIQMPGATPSSHHPYSIGIRLGNGV
jgi:hypothetical protein